MLITLSSTVSEQEWLTILQSKIPSFTASYRLSPESARGRMWVRWRSSPRLVLIQSEKASCSSTVTEWVVPAVTNIYFVLQCNLLHGLW